MTMSRTSITCSIVAALTAATISILQRDAAAQAVPPPPAPQVAPTKGLFWTMKTKGISTVQKLEDTTNGVVCYVAHGDSTSDTTAISCVKP